MYRYLVPVIFATAVNASAANLIVNGGFESPATAPGLNFNFGGGNSFLGWTVVGPASNAVTILNATYAETNILFQAQTGASSLDITGAGNAGPTAGVVQTVSTSVGQPYSLTFWVGNADGSGNSAFGLPSTVNLVINNGSPTSFTNSSVVFRAVQWSQFEYVFIAATPTTTLAFYNGTPAGDRFAGLDNISLQAVPEPSTLAFWSLGLIGLAIARRRLKANLRAGDA
jgi:hypothetical protein